MTRHQAVHNILTIAQIQGLDEVDMTLAIVMAYTLSKGQPVKEDLFFESLGVLIDAPAKVFASADAIALGSAG